MIFYLCSMLAFSQPRLSYKSEIEDRTLAKIIPILEEGNKALVNKHVQSFEAELFPSARVHYEIALHYNTTNQISDAMHHYNRALEIDSRYKEALYDRAELYLLQQNPEKALQDLETLVSLGVEHWVIFFRLSEIYAEKKNGVLLEQNLLLAIRYGFSLHLLLESGDKWKEYAKDPELSEHLHKTIQLYGDERIWDLLLQ
jgi:tetratricopeptide (TPR) repeat protein